MWTEARDRLLRGLLTIVAIAGLTSWLQWLVVIVRREAFGSFSWKWWLRDQVFLTTAGYLLLFLAAGLPLIVGHLALPRRITLPALGAVLAGFGTFCLLLLFEPLYWVASLVLAAGVAMRLHQPLAAHPERSWQWTRRAALATQAAAALVVLVQDVARGANERDAIKALPAARPDAPNVLLVVLDTERAADLSLYGAAVATTPALARRARGGVTFEAAFSTTSWTLPSHVSMFTGRYPTRASADWMAPLDETPPTLAESFRAAGYATAGFVANVNFTGYRTGLARGFTHYEDSHRSLQEILHGTTLMQAGSIGKALDTWIQTRWITGTVRAATSPLMLRPRDGVPERVLRRAPEVSAGFLDWLPPAGGRPFFAFLNLFDAHGPYQPPAPYRTMFDPEAGAHDRYLGAIRYLDDALEALLQALEQRGALDQTIVIVTSDHGELFGEHDRIGHGNGLFWSQLQVPLVVLNAPDGVPGHRVTQPVSLRDLPVTLLDLAGLTNVNLLPGVSLRPLLEGTPRLPGTSPVLATLNPGFNREALRVVPVPILSLVEDSSQVIVSASGDLTLFTRPRRSAEAPVRAADAETVPEARARLAAALAATGIGWKR